MYYIQESDKPCKILKFFNSIRLKDNEIILPIQKEELTDKQAEKLATKTYKVIRYQKTANQFVFSFLFGFNNLLLENH